MKTTLRIILVVMTILTTSQIFGQAVPPPSLPPPPPGLSLGIGEYFFLVVGLVFGIKEIKKVEDF
jgi:hypothetical protein